MHPEISKSLFEDQVQKVLKNPELIVNRGWLVLKHEYPNLVVAMRHRRSALLRVLSFKFDGWNDQPPSLTLLYIAYEAVSDLARKTAPGHSIPGIVLACVSLVVMPILSREKKKVGNALGSGAMNADARQTDFCVYLSAILLAGLVLNAVFGWWWADPVAALIMVPIVAKEGFEGIKARHCCD